MQNSLFLKQTSQYGIERLVRRKIHMIYFNCTFLSILQLIDMVTDKLLLYGKKSCKKILQETFSCCVLQEKKHTGRNFSHFSGRSSKPLRQCRNRQEGERVDRLMLHQLHQPLNSHRPAQCQLS